MGGRAGAPAPEVVGNAGVRLDRLARPSSSPTAPKSVVLNAPMAALHQARRGAFAAVLAERQLDAALVTTLLNVRYLAGFTGSAGALLVRADGSAEIATDGRYRRQVEAECPDVAAVITRSGRHDLADRAVI